MPGIFYVSPGLPHRPARHREEDRRVQEGRVPRALPAIGRVSEERRGES